MSLLKQLFLAICLFLVVAFTGSFIAGVETSREQLLGQLRSHAQDAATALGLSMTPHVDDPAMLELMVSSIFDSGYFSSIRVISIPDERVLIERTSTTASDVAPEWFSHLVSLNPQSGDALIMRGWEQAARIEVHSHPQFALARLWTSALATLAWLLACGVASAILGGWLLRTQLRPLDRMVDQAQAISHREFLTLCDVPRTPELRRVVMAMNQMVDKLKMLFAEEAARSEKLRREAYQDSLTGLANRRLFELRLGSQLTLTEQHSDGYLMLLRINDLNGLNQRHGGQYADRLIKAIGEVLEVQAEQHGNPDWLASRSRGGEFTLLAAGLAHQDALQLGARVTASLETLRHTGLSDCTPVAHIGLTAFKPGDMPTQVLARADQALALAQSLNDKPWALSNDDQQQTLGQQDWRDWIDLALTQSRLQLYFQPVAQCNDRQSVLHHKVLSRLISPEGEAVVAGRFLPWIERLGWSARLDQAMLTHCLDHLQRHPRPLALSLSPSTTRNPDSMQQLLTMLGSKPEQARLLSIELDARHLPEAPELQRLSQRIRAVGAHLGLQHFGGNFSLIGNLTHLGLAYLKIDGSYIRAIDQEADKRPFIEAIARAANSIDLPLIAEMVETEAELATLTGLGIEAAMGHVIGVPAAVLPEGEQALSS